jgi:hypothetical protein
MRSLSAVAAAELCPTPIFDLVAHNLGPDAAHGSTQAHSDSPTNLQQLE